MTETVLISGNEAIAYAALHTGCRAYFGYPITPSSEIMEAMARELPKTGGVFLQMEDEIASMAAMVGASWAGAKPMTATSGPGFSLMQENLGLATMLELPCVIVNVQRSGPSTGIPTLGAQQDTMQAIWGRHGDQTIIVVAPSKLQELYDLTIRAFNLAEHYRVPAVLLADGELARVRGEVVLREDLAVEGRRILEAANISTPYRAAPDAAPGFPTLGIGANVLATGLAHDERGYPTEDLVVNEQLLRRLRDKILCHVDDIVDYEVKDVLEAEIVFVGYGAAAASVRWAWRELRERGIKTGYFVPKTLSPFPDQALAEALATCKQVVIAEMSLGQVIHLVREVVGLAMPIDIVSSIGAPIDPRRLVDVALHKLQGQ